MLYTTYFAAVKKLPEGIEPVSIARFTPKTIKGMRSCSKFFPPEDLIKAYKAKEISDEEYTKAYKERVLAGLDAKAAAKALDGKALVCFEKPGDFCHRHIVAEWFCQNGISCEEIVVAKKKASTKGRKKKSEKKDNGQMSLSLSGVEETQVPPPVTVLGPPVAANAPRPVRKFPLRYKEINGDLFSAPDRYALAHCVSADKALGAGIALEFRNRYPNMLKKFEGTKFEVGKCYGYTEPEPRRSIINIVTKEKYSDKPTYDDFAKAIQSLKEVVVAHRIKFLAVPLLGCGLDQLDWERVSYILTGTFYDVDVAIVVYRKAAA